MSESSGPVGNAEDAPIEWQPGETRYYIDSACRRYTISKTFDRDHVIYTAWARGPSQNPYAKYGWTAILYSSDLQAAKAACAEDSEKNCRIIPRSA